MKRTISLLLVFVMLMATAVTTAFVSAEDTLPFTDVNEGDWFYEYVKEVYDAKIMQGMPGNVFNPNNAMTRAELVTTLCNFSDVDPAGLGADITFTDVPKTEWFADYIGWAVKENIVNGDSEFIFRPNDPINREELATVINRYVVYAELEIKGEVLIDKFDDEADFSWWSVEHIETLRAMGLVAGKTGGNYEPKSTATRAEVATIVSRMIVDEIPETTEPETTEPETTEPETTEPETTEPETTEPETTEPDATPDNIGVEYEKDGIKISYLSLIKDENGPIYSTPTGTHGGHENRVIRTENGVYGAYIINETTAPTEEHPLWGPGVAEAAIFKVTADGFKIIHTYEFPRSNSSCTPNVLYDGKGKVYVTTITGDEESYQTDFIQQGAPSDYKSGAWLDVFVIDTNTDKLVHHAHSIQKYDTNPFQDHGYGKTNPIMDAENGKIYALANGGEAPRAFIAWFIYDIEKGEWEDGCHTIELKERRDYINGFADGKGGFTFVIQRAGTVENRTEVDGFQFSVFNTYLWDGIYIYNIPDAYRTEYKEVPVKLAEYSLTEVNKPEHITYFGDANGGGTSYRDFDGNIHILYTHQKNNKYTTYHAIYDKELNKIYNAPIKFTEKQTNKRNMYSMGMTQGPSGKYYIIAEHVYSEKAYTNASFEIWSSDDGINFERVVDRHELKTEDGKTVPSGRLSVANSRMNGVVDGIVPIIFNGYYNEETGTYGQSTGAKDCYYSVVVELP